MLLKTKEIYIITTLFIITKQSVNLLSFRCSNNLWLYCYFCLGRILIIILQLIKNEHTKSAVNWTENC